MEDKSHENQAVSITGIYKGDLMCETRNKNKEFTKTNPKMKKRSA